MITPRLEASHFSALTPLCFLPDGSTHRNNGAPHVPIASSAPNSTTASMLSRPCRDQYAAASRFSHSANSSSVSAAPIPYASASNRLRRIALVLISEPCGTDLWSFRQCRGAAWKTVAGKPGFSELLGTLEDLHQAPVLGGRQRAGLHDEDPVAHAGRVGLVVRLDLGAATDDLAVEGVLDAVLDLNNNGLVHLAADDIALTSLAIVALFSCSHGAPLLLVLTHVDHSAALGRPMLSSRSLI